MSRETFISKLSTLISNYVDTEQARILNMVVSEFCADYDIQDRCTEVTLYDGYMPLWINEYATMKVIGGCKDNSMEDYAFHLKDFFNFVALPVEQITESDIVKYLGVCLKLRNNSKSYVDHKRTVINDFFNWSANKGYLNNNPCKTIPVIKSQRTKRVPYSDDELTTIRNEVDNLRDKAIIETMICTACRVAELCGLNRDSINYETGEVKLKGKGDKTRTVYLNPEMKHALTKYLETRTDNNSALFVGRRKSRKTGEYERVTVDGIECMTRRLSKAIGVNMIQPHRFRKTTATKLNKVGMKLTNTQRFLGHTSIETTMRYVYSNQDDLKYELNKFN